MQCNARQDKAMQGKTRQGKARQGKALQSKARFSFLPIHATKFDIHENAYFSPKNRSS